MTTTETPRWKAVPFMTTDTPLTDDHIVNANKMVSDTPRTDAASFSSRDPLELMKTSQQLERELTHSLQNQLKSQAEVERLRGIANRAISTLVIVTYGEATIDFWWPDIMRKVGELRNEFPFLGSTTEESSVIQSSLPPTHEEVMTE